MYGEWRLGQSLWGNAIMLGRYYLYTILHKLQLKDFESCIRFYSFSW
jgi:hypothetical protein